MGYRSHTIATQNCVSMHFIITDLHSTVSFHFHLASLILLVCLQPLATAQQIQQVKGMCQKYEIPHIHQIDH
jgi:hypothetical protein